MRAVGTTSPSSGRASAQHELDPLAGRIEGAKPVSPSPCNLGGGFINSPGPIRTRNSADLKLAHSADPAPDGDMMVNRRVPLRQDLLQIAVGEGISQISNSPEDDHV